MTESVKNPSAEDMDEQSEELTNSQEVSEESKSKEPLDAPKQNRVRKRSKKRRRDDGKDRQIEIKKERFDKLLYQAKKDLHKQAKQCRTFLVQKSIRKLKKQGETTSSSSSSKLQSMKDLPLDRVVEQAVRQLGLLHANPDPEADFTPPEPLTPELKRQVDTVLTHGRFQKVLEGWHAKVTEYRRWALNFDERMENRQNPRKDTTTTTTMRSTNQPMSVFCSLNEGDNADGNEVSPYGPGAYMEEVPIKKNRKGQRARRAKAMAIQAKKEGKKYESLNWRSAEEKKVKKQKVEEEAPAEEENNHPSWAAKRNEPSGIVEFKGTKVKFGEESENRSEQAAENHPSWEAKKAQKSGIVAFKGTKITF